MPDRIALYLVTHEDFVRILQSCDGRTPIRVQGLPDSPEILDFWASGLHHGGIFVKVRSPELEEVADGEEIPADRGLLFVPCRETSPNVDQVIASARDRLSDNGVDRRYGDVVDDSLITLLLRKLEESGVRETGLRQEVEQLRSIFNDWRIDHPEADPVYQQGW